MAKPSVPKAPAYTPPPAYKQPAPYQSPAPYVNPGKFVMPPNPNKTIPNVFNYAQLAQKGFSLSKYLPPQLNLWTQPNPLDPEGRQQFQDQYYQLYVRPGVEAAKSSVYNNGQADSAYGGGYVAQAEAMGNLAAYQASLQMAQQRFEDMLAGRQSYFSNDLGLIQQQNNADVARGTNVAQLDSSNYANMNQYNLNSSNAANQFNLSNANSANAYNLDTNNALNNYSLGANQGQNSFNLGRYSGQLQGYGYQQSANRNALFGGLGAIGSIR